MLAHNMVLHLDRYLAAAQLGITVASLGLGWIGEPAFAGLIEIFVKAPGWWSHALSHSISVATAFLLITFLHILLGELAPKSIAIRRAERSALWIAFPMLWAYRLFYLPMIVLNGASNMLLRLMGLHAGHPEMAHTEHELRALLAKAQSTRDFSLNRLLMLENIFDLGGQTVNDATIPWSRVHYLLRSTSFDEVMQLVKEHRFSRWPVLDPASGLPGGYLLTKDLIAESSNGRDWQKLVRPLRTVHPRDNLEAVMQQLQKDGANMAAVIDGRRPVGLITLEDILEEIVGRIEDEYPRLPPLFLTEALTAGAIVLDLPAQTWDEAIRELAALVPAQSLPSGTDACVAVLKSSRQTITDIGSGIAIPRTRSPGLARPLIVFGRLREGIMFDEKSIEPVYLIFLLLTPSDRPHAQVFLLERLAKLSRTELVRERLLRAQTAQDIFEIIATADEVATEE